MAVVLVPEEGKHTRKFGKHLGIGRGTSIDAVEIVAVRERDTPAAVEDKWIVVAGIPAEVADKRTAGVDTSERSAVVGGNVKGGIVSILMGNPVHQGRSKPGGKAVGIFVYAAEVDYSQTRLETDRMMGLVRVA